MRFKHFILATLYGFKYFDDIKGYIVKDAKGVVCKGCSETLEHAIDIAWQIKSTR